MNIDELTKNDASFSIPSFLATADNTYMMLQTAIMLGNLSRIKNKLSDNLIQKYQSIIDDFNNNGLRQMYDDLAVKKTEILSVNKDDNKYYIKVYIKSIAKDYVVDKTNMEYRYGINNQMIEKNNYLTFSRIINNVKDNWMLEKIVTN
jgi:predicted lipid-binding transport protein (Tim44 family)